MNSTTNKSISQETADKLVSLLAHTPQEHAARSLEIAKKPMVHIQNSQIAAGVLGTTGLIIFALGIENLISSIPELQSPFIEIALGLFLLTISGLFLKKLI